MTETRTVEYWLAIRKEEGLKIDPATGDIGALAHSWLRIAPQILIALYSGEASALPALAGRGDLTIPCQTEYNDGGCSCAYHARLRSS